MMTDETPSTDPSSRFRTFPAWPTFNLVRPGRDREPVRNGLYPTRNAGPETGREATADRGATTVKAVSPGGNVVLTVKAAKEGLTGKTARAAPSATAAIKLPAPPWRNRRKACAWSCAPWFRAWLPCTEVQKHRRTISLLDLAKVVMGSYDRYDLVFMKQENGPDLYHCKHGDGACFISRQEAVKHLWRPPGCPNITNP